METTKASALEKAIKKMLDSKIEAKPDKPVSPLLPQPAIDNLVERMSHPVSRKNDPRAREPAVEGFTFKKLKKPLSAQDCPLKLQVLRRKTRQIARKPTTEYKPRCTHAIRRMEALRAKARQMFQQVLSKEQETTMGTMMMLRARAAAGYYVFARVLFGRLRADNVDVQAELRRVFGAQQPKVAQVLQCPTVNPPQP